MDEHNASRRAPRPRDPIAGKNAAPGASQGPRTASGKVIAMPTHVVRAIFFRPKDDALIAAYKVLADLGYVERRHETNSELCIDLRSGAITEAPDWAEDCAKVLIERGYCAWRAPRFDAGDIFGMTAVESSNVKAIGYYAEKRRLRIEFIGSSIYEYHDVNPASWLALLWAESKGKYLNASIKPSHKVTRVG